MLLDNLEQGVKLLMKHIQSNNKIFVQIDEDHVLAYTSELFFLNYLNSLFPFIITQNNIIVKHIIKDMESF